MSDSTGNPSRPDQSDATGGQPAGYPPPTGQPAPPYGQQPSAPSPYEQPQGAPAPYEETTQPHGQQPDAPRQSYTEMYGPQYGAPAYAQPGYGQPNVADRRPGTVTTAGVLTLVFSGLALVLFGIVLIAVLVARDMIGPELEQAPGLEGISVDQIVTVAAVTVGVLAVWALIAMILAVFAMRRSNGARIGLVISAVVTALFCGLSLVSAADPFSLLMILIVLGAAVTTVVCLFAGGASAWYAGRHGPRTTGPQGSPVA